MANTRLTLLGKLKNAIVTTNSWFYPDSYLNGIIQEAYEFAAALHNWPHTERFFKATTFPGDERYDYPAVSSDGTAFKTDGITYLDVDGMPYTRLDFDSYRQEKLNPSGWKFFSDYSRQIFIYPIPTTVVEIDAWWCSTPVALAADGDATVFADAEPEIENAIVRIALSKAIEKTRKWNESTSILNSAISMLEIVWKKIAMRQQSAKSNRQSFSHTDYFAPWNGWSFTPWNFDGI